jgi:hypothetical protein
MKNKSGKIMVDDFAPGLPASIMMGGGTSLAQTNRVFQEGYSKNISKKFSRKVFDTLDNAH